MVTINFNAVKTLLKKNATKRPILACISYQEGKILFTDSYSLVEIAATNKQVFNLNVMTLRLHEGSYPTIDKIKPTVSELEAVSGIVIKLNDQKEEIYDIDGYPFHKAQVDQTFKTVGISFLKDIPTEKLKLKKNDQVSHKSALLVYDDIDEYGGNTEGLYILVLGLATTPDQDEK